MRYVWEQHFWLESLLRAGCFGLTVLCSVLKSTKTEERTEVTEMINFKILRCSYVVKREEKCDKLDVGTIQSCKWNVTTCKEDSTELQPYRAKLGNTVCKMVHALFS
jgi:hypothetical protein